MTAEAPGLALRGLTRRHGATVALDRLSLRVAPGAFLTLLGPSGSGKTTALMCIAGFLAPDEGAVLLDGQDITALPPERRGFGMVFQSHALFPQMSVAQNIAFPLRIRGLPRAERESRVRAALDLVRLPGLEDRLPRELSGGQQQRVALARALVFGPRLLLLDEPLSALDRALRAELQEELKALHRRTGLTFVNVTHDQEEALSLSDRVAILDRGRLVQEGTPQELYERPRSRFVASFLGAANILRGVVEEVGAAGFVLRSGATRLVQSLPPGTPRPAHGMPALLVLRPEKIALLAGTETAENETTGVVESWSYLGAGFALTLRTADLGLLRVALPAWGAPVAPAEGLWLRLGWASAATVPVQDDP